MRKSDALTNQATAENLIGLILVATKLYQTKTALKALLAFQLFMNC